MDDDLYDLYVLILLVACVVVGIVVTARNFVVVNSYDQRKASSDSQSGSGGDDEPLNAGEVTLDERCKVAQEVFNLTSIIRKGSRDFLYAEYKLMLVFVALFSGLVWALTGATGRRSFAPTDKTMRYGPDWMFGFLSAMAFIVGALTSMAAGWLSM